MYTKTKQKQVEDVLLTQIVVTSEVNNIFKYNDKIYSSQSYESGLDPDMSDFAIAFYEIIYNKKIISNGQIIDMNFAGDTINTGIHMKGQRKKVKLENRHCLANFWVIPYVHGRKREKPKRDYWDLYLSYVKENISAYDKNFEQNHDFKDFKVTQFIPENVNSSTLMHQEISIKNRAKLLAKSDVGDKLWLYFADNSLL